MDGFTLSAVMEGLTEIFELATAAIGHGYFHLEIDGGEPVYRERVYCYELYHQMRLRWPEDTQFYLNGEIDKAAHPILAQLGAGLAKPDFLVHRPGYMEGNHAVIEVKSQRAGNGAILEDLRKLSRFVTHVGYERAIYLIYGFQAGPTADRIRSFVQQNGEDFGFIEIWVHAHPGDACARV